MSYNYDPVVGKPITRPGEDDANKSLIFGIIGVFFFSLLFGILALVYAKKATDSGLYNDGKLTAGKVLGWIDVIFGSIGAVVFVFIILSAILSAA